MTNLTAPQPRIFTSPTMSMPCSTHDAGGVLYEGAAVQFASDGDLENVVGTDTTFCGFLDNSATAEGDRCKVWEEGKVKLTVAKGTNWVESDKGTIVYATDGNTFTKVNTSAQPIGRVVEIHSGIGTLSAEVTIMFRARQLFDQA